MFSVQTQQLPENALLQRYRVDDSLNGKTGYTDCYITSIDSAVSLNDFVYSFYSSRIFRLEAWLLGVFADRPSTNQQARALASGELDQFAAWHVEDRSADQLLMCDYVRRTRSWFMVEPCEQDGAHSILYFGSAIVAVPDKTTGQLQLGKAYTFLLGFHKLYSRILLSAARAQLNKRIR